MSEVAIVGGVLVVLAMFLIGYVFGVGPFTFMAIACGLAVLSRVNLLT